MRSPTFLSFFTFVFLAAGTGSAEDCGALPATRIPTPHVVLSVASDSTSPVLTIRSKGAEGVIGGFEGGTVVKADGSFHAFLTEMMAGYATRLALWTSLDGDHWSRIGTLFSSSGDYTGEDRRASLWAAMPIYDSDRGEWNLFYVAYRSKPNTPAAWYANYDGEIVRAVSRTKGKRGIDGPYADADVILSPEKNPDSWEGLQGTDSFFPYRVRDGWMGFYGTAHTEAQPISSWRVGVAAAPSLHGPWRRCSALNPSPVEKHFIENPVVSRIGASFLAVYDVDVDAGNAIGYTESQDGANWTPGTRLQIFPGHDIQARTPLALIDDGHGGYDLFVTAYAPVPDGQGKTTSTGAMFHLKVKAR
jgi:hypothetical protein